MRPEVTGKNPIAGQEVRPVQADELSPIRRQTYTVEEAAKIVGICRAVAYRPGVLPTIRVAGRLLVPKQALERMLGEKKLEAADERHRQPLGRLP